MLKNLFQYLQKLQNRIKKHQIAAYSGQMAYFFMLSIFPLLIFVFTIISKLNLNFDFAYEALQSFLPPNISSLITNFIENTIYVEGNAVLSISGIVTLYSASRAVSALQRAINTAYGIEQKGNFFLNKLSGMMFTLMFVALIVVSVTIPNVGSRIAAWMTDFFDFTIEEQWITMFYWIRNLILPAVYILVFGSIYTVLPNKKMHLEETYKGSIFAITGSLATNWIFSTVVVKLTDYSILYGSLSAIIAFMIWLYALGTIIMIGAEINAIEIEHIKK